MPTKAQTDARRANARLSQGPKTEGGKAKSRMNALKFGFCAEEPLVPGEDPQAFLEFRLRLHDSLRPVGEIEGALANRVADSLWRLRRFPTVEAGIFTVGLCEEEANTAHDRVFDLLNPHLLRDPEAVPPDVRAAMLREEEARAEARRPEYALGRIFMHDCSSGGLTFARLTRYETAIEYAMYRTLHQLQRMQAIREARQKGSGDEKPLVRNDLTEDLTQLDRAA